MITFSLQSGSNGNSIYVETAGARLLFDAGISGRQARERLAAHGRSIRDVDALIISHDHSDHVSGAGPFHRLFHLPVYVTRVTHQATHGRMGKLHDVRFFESGQTLRFGRTLVHTFRTPHDAADGVAFVVEADNRRLGLFTDLGRPFAALFEALDSVDAAYVESNYDPRMLAAGPYPEELKARISGGQGHLSNDQAAELIAEVGFGRLKWAALAHLSGENNTPELALNTHRRRFDGKLPLWVAGRDGVSEVWEV